MKLDKYKEAIVEAFDTTNKNIFASAAPGTGKSYILKVLSKRVTARKAQIYLAFNKSIVEEIKHSLPDQVEVSTIHSKAFSVLRKNAYLNVSIAKDNNFTIAKKLCSLNHVKLTPGEIDKFPKAKQMSILGKRKLSYLLSVSDLVNLIKLNLTDLNVQDIETLADDYGIDYEAKMGTDSIKIINHTGNMLIVNGLVCRLRL